MPYYIEACLLRNPYFMTLAVLLARTEQITKWSVFSDPVTYPVALLYINYIIF